jgi:hypothetical protein
MVYQWCLKRHGVRIRPPWAGISTPALRLIGVCLKLFVSVCFRFANWCAVSFRTVILHTHAE